MPTQKLIRPVGLVLSFFILLGVYTKLVGPIEFRVNQISTQKAATFDMSGEGSVAAVPDQAQVNLGITVTQPTVTPAQKQANEIINSITKTLKDNGVGESQIKTTNYSINPNYDYQSGQQITGYTVSANLEVKFTDFDKLNQTIDQAVVLGANQIGAVSFSLSNPAKAQAEDQARQQAVAQAKVKAKSLAQAAGIRLGRIVNVYESTPYPPELPIYADLEAKSAEIPTQIQPGSTEVRLTVTLSYETL